MNRKIVARKNWTNICIVVTNSGYGKPKCRGENIHLLYRESTVANRYLNVNGVSRPSTEWVFEW